MLLFIYLGIDRASDSFVILRMNPTPTPIFKPSADQVSGIIFTPQLLQQRGIFALIILRLKKNICVFQVSRPYLRFSPDPKHFVVIF